MFMSKYEGRCPMCGVTGKTLNLDERGMKDKINNCPSCGTIFNNFGVVVSLMEQKEMQWT